MNNAKYSSISLLSKIIGYSIIQLFLFRVTLCFFSPLFLSCGFLLFIFFPLAFSLFFLFFFLSFFLSFFLFFLLNKGPGLFIRNEKVGPEKSIVNGHLLFNDCEFHMKKKYTRRRRREGKNRKNDEKKRILILQKKNLKNKSINCASLILFSYSLTGLEWESDSAPPMVRKWL